MGIGVGPRGSRKTRRACEEEVKGRASRRTEGVVDLGDCSEGQERG